MLGKLGRHPAHIGCMALCTGRWKARTLVIGVYRTLKIRLVAGKAICWRIREVATRMAPGAVLNIMPFCKREKIVVQAFRRPVEAIHGMAFRTIQGKAGIIMVRVGGGVEIIQVAIHTIIADAAKLQP